MHVSRSHESFATVVNGDWLQLSRFLIVGVTSQSRDMSSHGGSELASMKNSIF